MDTEELFTTEELFDAYPEINTPEMQHRMNEWKEAHRSIYAMPRGDTVYILREASVGEFNRAYKMQKDGEIEEANDFIFSRCLLYPDPETLSVDDVPARVPDDATQKIMQEAGYFMTELELEEMLEEKEESESGSFTQMACLVVKGVFPEMSLKEIEALPFESLIEYYVKAKWIRDNVSGGSAG